jgi:hypothetical protein
MTTKKRKNPDLDQRINLQSKEEIGSSLSLDRENQSSFHFVI